MDEDKNKPSSQNVIPPLQSIGQKQPKEIPVGGSHWQRFKGWYGFNKKWTIPATIIILVAIIAGVPWSRYKVASLALKKNFTVEIIDASSRTPVSGARVSEGSLSALSDGNGKATLHPSDGYHTLNVSKKYYKDSKSSVVVPIFSQRSIPVIPLTATGRQAKVVIKNLINQKVLANVDIKLADTTAKTDNNGVAVVVVPAGTTSQKATLSLDGYNNSDVVITISESKIAENNFNLTPVGMVYFLSKRTGKLDLMKTNLDGSGTTVAVAGTGTEHDYDTVLLPSLDWKYVALVAKRSSSDPTPQLYVLSTSDGKLLKVDSGNSNFTMRGWVGDNLIYYVVRNDIASWQTGKDRLKAYDAGSGKTTLLDQSSATGDSTASAYEYYALVTISGNTILYAKSWTQAYSYSPPDLLSGKQNSLQSIGPNGQNHKTLATYNAANNVQYTMHSPDSVYIWEQADKIDKFYDYTIGASAPKSINLTTDQFYQDYPVYYPSASGKQTFWAENRDGKNTLFIGNDSGENSSVVATLSEYDPYSWFSEDYLLVTKKNSELYIMSNRGGNAVKITDYQPTSNGRGL